MQIRDRAKQTVYFDNAVVSPDQRFAYDRLYRLVHAEGREHTSLTQPPHADLSFGPQAHPNDPSHRHGPKSPAGSTTSRGRTSSAGHRTEHAEYRDGRVRPEIQPARRSAFCRARVTTCEHRRN
jgi:hypothetical protein